MKQTIAKASMAAACCITVFGTVSCAAPYADVGPLYCHVYQDQLSQEKYCKTSPTPVWWVLVKDDKATSAMPNDPGTYWVQRPNRSLLYGNVPSGTLEALPIAVKMSLDLVPENATMVPIEQAALDGRVVW